MVWRLNEATVNWIYLTNTDDKDVTVTLTVNKGTFEFAKTVKQKLHNGALKNCKTKWKATNWNQFLQEKLLKCMVGPISAACSFNALTETNFVQRVLMDYPGQSKIQV